MSDLAQSFMDVDSFLAWSEGQDARFELHEGVVIAMAPERYAHLETKLAVVNALQAAIRSAGAPCRALPDGATVRTSKKTAFVPDALVYCGPRPDPGALEIANPVIVVEVLSPSTLRADFGVKLEAYFTIHSVAHYLIIDPDRRKVIHHARGLGDVLQTRIIGEGALRLDPPGLELHVESLFGPD
jgi:Uma2 family endonuclease